MHLQALKANTEKLTSDKNIRRGGTPLHQHLNILLIKLRPFDAMRFFKTESVTIQIDIMRFQKLQKENKIIYS